MYDHRRSVQGQFWHAWTGTLACRQGSAACRFGAHDRDHYTTDERERDEIFASPLVATIEQLRGLPPALIQTAELDVLRDEGEAYARKLDAAGVDVVCLRVGGMIHDFGMLNFLSQVPAVQAVVRQAADEIKRRLA
jgi:acetyl esterase/lipase